MASTLKPFVPDTKAGWETYSSAAHGDGLSVFVSGRNDEVRLSCVNGSTQTALYLTPNAARLLAAELVAAADSTVREVA